MSANGAAALAMPSAWAASRCGAGLPFGILSGSTAVVVGKSERAIRTMGRMRHRRRRRSSMRFCFRRALSGERSGGLIAGVRVELDECFSQLAPGAGVDHVGESVGVLVEK